MKTLFSGLRYKSPNIVYGANNVLVDAPLSIQGFYCIHFLGNNPNDWNSSSHSGIHQEKRLVEEDFNSFSCFNLL
jgi:hypothetical protein